jgi:SRSO17 transposase
MNQHGMRACAERLEQFLSSLLVPVGRSERRQHGKTYIQGLLLDGERKSIEPMAARVPASNVQALQQFVGQSPWAWEPVRKLLAQQMSERLLPTAGWIVDDTGFPKQGSESVGVARQYSGTLGKVGNCQVAVSVHLTTPEESLPLNWALYLPESWLAERERCRKVGVPEGTPFRTKPALALELIDQLLGWGLEAQPVLADVAYGNNTEFRQALAARGLRYMVGVESTTTAWPAPARKVQPRRHRPQKIGRPRGAYYPERPKSVEQLARAGRSSAWQTVRWRPGSRGGQASRFAACRVQPAHGPLRHGGEPETLWLLIEWPEEAAAPSHYWLSNLPAYVSRRCLVQLAKLRWRVEQNYQQLKEELGLDHYEGRGGQGWHHHVTLVSLAYAFLVSERLQDKKNSVAESA